MSLLICFRAFSYRFWRVWSEIPEMPEIPAELIISINYRIILTYMIWKLVGMIVLWLDEGQFKTIIPGRRFTTYPRRCSSKMRPLLLPSRLSFQLIRDCHDSSKQPGISLKLRLLLVFSGSPTGLALVSFCICLCSRIWVLGRCKRTRGQLWIGMELPSWVTGC